MTRSSSAPEEQLHRLSVALVAAIAILLLVPVPALPLPESWPFPADWTLAVPLDKLVHFLLFLVASRPWFRSLRALGSSRFGRPVRAAAGTVLFALGYGLLLELAQGLFTSTRTPELADALAGALGAAVGVAFWSRGVAVRRPG
ncbi:MAG: hypothetical protein AB7G12_14230 [Thermoanaerobaculia bacterium]